MSRPRFLADHNFNQDIVDGLTRREPAILIMLASEVDMQESSDPELLEFAARADLLVLTHDLKTMPGHAYERGRGGPADARRNRDPAVDRDRPGDRVPIGDLVGRKRAGLS